MADFCRRCVVDLFEVPAERNDFAGWLDEWTAFKAQWAICEGCGCHLIDNTGERLCGDKASMDRDLLSPCPECRQRIGQSLPVREGG